MPWSFEESRPIYTQLIERIQRRIVTGAYPQGGRLPSVRELAQEAGVNPNTVQRAFAELERDALIVTQRTAGKFVTEDAAVIDGLRLRLARAQAEGCLTALRELGYSAAQSVEFLQKMAQEETQCQS